ncbi:MAG: hypothetical protein ACR2FY_17155 [Pirellulaceae bacterium]
MRFAISRRQFLASGILGGVCSAVGCGTIMYPERRGQRSGTLDPGIVVLDGLGLLLFFIPGVIAFAVDFATGAIYLPEGGGPSISQNGEPRPFEKISLAPDQLSRPRIAQAVSQHAGREIRLEEGEFRTAKLPDLDHFWPAMDELLAAHQAKPDAEVLRAQSP